MGLGKSAAEISRKPYRLIFLDALAVRYFSLLKKSGSPGRCGIQLVCIDILYENQLVMMVSRSGAVIL